MSTQFLSRIKWAKNIVLSVIAGAAVILSGCSDDDDPVATCSGSIANITDCNGDFDTLYAAVAAAGLGETLSGGEYTVFAPTDDAFATLLTQLGVTAETFLARDDLAQILQYHVLAGNVDSTAAIAAAGTSNNTVTTAETSELTLSLSEGNLFVNRSQVTQADVSATNGVIHAIDKVLIPPGYFNVVETAQADGRFTTLVTAVVTAGLTNTLATTADITVFAPTDDAFADLIESNDAFSSAADILALTNLSDILTYHVLGSELDSQAAVALAGQTTGTLNTSVNIGISYDDPDLYINTSKVIVADVDASNGYIHAIDKVLLQPSADALSNTEQTIAELVTTLASAETGAEFTTLLSALQQENLAAALGGEGPFTVFAPTDAAFALVGTPEAVLALDGLDDILKQHVISGTSIDSVSAYAANGTGVATLRDNTNLNVSIGEMRDLMVGNAKVVITDVSTSNGVIHVIDAVITSP